MNDVGLGPLPDVERALGRIVALFSVLFTVATAGELFDAVGSAGGVAVVVLIAAPIIVTAVAAVVGRMSAARWGAALACYVTAVIVWGLSGGMSAPGAATPAWPTTMLAVAVLQTQLAVRRLRRTVLVAVGLSGLLAVIGVLRHGQSESDALALAGSVALPAILLSFVLALVARTADRTGRTQQEVLRQIAAVRFDDATEAERVRTDALVHDTVLTTLLQAASAEEREGANRAKQMAVNAKRVLSHVRRSRDLGTGVRLRSAVSAHEQHLVPLLRRFEVSVDDHALEGLLLPQEVADALLVALVEAMDNSVRHAGAHRRTVRLRALGPDGLRIEIEDDGCGFDPGLVDGEGIMARIIAPMLMVEGRVQVRSTPSTGTSVHLSWGSVSVTDVRSPSSRLQEADR